MTALEINFRLVFSVDWGKKSVLIKSESPLELLHKTILDVFHEYGVLRSDPQHKDNDARQTTSHVAIGTQRGLKTVFHNRIYPVNVNTFEIHQNRIELPLGEGKHMTMAFTENLVERAGGLEQTRAMLGDALQRIHDQDLITL